MTVLMYVSKQHRNKTEKHSARELILKRQMIFFSLCKYRDNLSRIITWFKNPFYLLGTFDIRRFVSDWD